MFFIVLVKTITTIEYQNYSRLNTISKIIAFLIIAIVDNLKNIFLRCLVVTSPLYWLLGAILWVILILVTTKLISHLLCHNQQAFFLFSFFFTDFINSLDSFLCLMSLILVLWGYVRFMLSFSKLITRINTYF